MKWLLGAFIVLDLSLILYCLVFKLERKHNYLYFNLSKIYYNKDRVSINNSEHSKRVRIKSPIKQGHNYSLKYVLNIFNKNLTVSIKSQMNINNTERVVVYLLNREKLNDWLSSLYLLFHNFLKYYPYKILVFHDAPLSKEEIMKSYNSKFKTQYNNLNASILFKLLEFHPVVFWKEFPKSFKDFNMPNLNSFILQRAYPDYNRMIAFWHRNIFLQPRMQHVSYYLRLDTDSYILSPIKYDIFNFMESRKLKYGYRAVLRESCCVQNFQRFLQLYISKLNISISQLDTSIHWLLSESISPLETKAKNGNVDDNTQMGMYYNNFELLHVPSFRDDPQVWNFIESVWDDSILKVHGIFRYRWGDNLIRYYTINMYPQLYHSTHVFCDIHYFHQIRFMATCSHSEKQILWPPRGRVHRNEYAKLCDRYKHLVGNCHRSIPSEFIVPADFAFP